MLLPPRPARKDSRQNFQLYHFFNLRASSPTASIAGSFIVQMTSGDTLVSSKSKCTGNLKYRMLDSEFWLKTRHMDQRQTNIACVVKGK